MTTRVLDWNGLCRVAERRNPADRIVDLAGLRTRVVPSRTTDCGFYVRSDSDASGRIDGYWALRTQPEILLLRELVDRGSVTVDDDEDPRRLAEWRAKMAPEGKSCFIPGCPYNDIDERGPVFTTDGRMHLACTRHWEAVYLVLGEAAVEARDAEEAARG